MKKTLFIFVLICLFITPAAAEMKSSKTVDDDGVIHINITGDSPKKAASTRAKEQPAPSVSPSFKPELDDICNNVPKKDDPRPDSTFKSYMERADILKPVIENDTTWASYKVVSLRMLANCKSLFSLELISRESVRNYNTQVETLQRSLR